jgi:hypothetical protein
MDDYETLVERAASLGVSKEQVFVPFMVLDQDVLIGPDQIQAELPGLIEEYLAQGGLEWPSWLDLSTETTATAASASEQVFSGGVARAVVFTTLDCNTCRGELAVLLRPMRNMETVRYRSIDIGPRAGGIHLPVSLRCGSA